MSIWINSTVVWILAGCREFVLIALVDLFTKILQTGGNWGFKIGWRHVRFRLFRGRWTVVIKSCRRGNCGSFLTSFGWLITTFELFRSAEERRLLRRFILIDIVWIVSFSSSNKVSPDGRKLLFSLLSLFFIPFLCVNGKNCFKTTCVRWAKRSYLVTSADTRDAVSNRFRRRSPK